MFRIPLYNIKEIYRIQAENIKNVILVECKLIIKRLYAGHKRKITSNERLSDYSYPFKKDVFQLGSGKYTCRTYSL